MKRDKINDKQLLEMLKAIDLLTKESLHDLKEAASGIKAASDFVTGCIVLIVKTMYLANCDLVSADQSEIDRFENTLKFNFDSLADLHKFYLVLSDAEPRTLRELAAVTIQTRDRLCLGAREEYVNRFIVFLTIEADKLAKQEKPF